MRNRGSRRSPRARSAHQEPPAQERRLDSLALLLQGSDTCAAAYFDGKHRKIILATNKNKPTLLIIEARKYLSFVAEESMTALFNINFPTSPYTSHQTKDEILLSLNEAIRVRKEALQRILETTKIWQKQYVRPQVVQALDKVTLSIRDSYLAPDKQGAFPLEISKAIRNDDFKFIDSYDGWDKQPHAELKIVDYLYDMYEENEEELRKWISLYDYIGISRRRCCNCEAAIQALEDCLNLPFRVRDRSHDGVYSAGIPNFLLKNLEIQNRFLYLFGLSCTDPCPSSSEDPLKEVFSRYESSRRNEFHSVSYSRARFSLSSDAPVSEDSMLSTQRAGENRSNNQNVLRLASLGVSSRADRSVFFRSRRRSAQQSSSTNNLRDDYQQRRRLRTPRTSTRSMLTTLGSSSGEVSPRRISSAPQTTLISNPEEASQYFSTAGTLDRGSAPQSSSAAPKHDLKESPQQLPARNQAKESNRSIFCKKPPDPSPPLKASERQAGIPPTDSKNSKPRSILNLVNR